MDNNSPAYDFIPLPPEIAAEAGMPGGERLLHYVWFNRLWQPFNLYTTDGLEVEVINTGRINVHAGPDFFNAIVRIGGTIWSGNVEIHISSADWYHHGHDKDNKYNNVVLHVCKHVEKEIFTASGTRVPQVEIRVPESVISNYAQLINEMEYPPCYRVLPQLPNVMIRGWLDKMCVERIELKTARIEQYLATCNNDWERAFFITLARAFGFGVNAEMFERWAEEIPLSALAHHRDDVLQVEAFFFGQAGMLDDTFPKVKDDYFQRLQDEYKFLQHKFGLTPLEGNGWKFLRMRPQNFPTIRLAQLAMLYTKGALTLSATVEAADMSSLSNMLSAGVSEYWETHYVFGLESTRRSKRIQQASIQRLVLNAVCPVLFAYGRYSGKEELAERAFNLLQQLPAEDDRIVRKWAETGIYADNAADSQALIQMYGTYCQRKDCLRCVIGREYLKASPNK